MRFILFAIFAAVFGVPFLAKAQTAQSLEIPVFKGIDVQTNADVYLSYGKAQKVRVEGSAATIQQLSKRVNSRGVWNINCPVKDDQTLRIYITTPSIPSNALASIGG